MRWLLHVFVGAALATCGWAASSHAAAQDTVDDPERVEEALVMYERARERYEAGDFERAVVLLEEALALHDAPELHYNLARALQELGRWSEARDEYVAYRERAPESAVSERVDARIDQLDRRIAEEAAERVASAPPPEPAPPEPPPPATLELAPWFLAGAGALVAVGAIPLGVLFLDAESQAAAATSHEEAFGPANDAEMFAIMANVVLSTGLVTGLVGVIWGIVTLSP